jgi:hypothetical protein
MMLLLLLLACPQTAPAADTADPFPGDDDADGWTVDEGDCDDADRTISPGAVEVWYDGIDQDCDGIDDDQDGDGVGVDRDCDDTDATVFPRAPELCDALDNDCDGTVDDDPEEGVVRYIDQDGDGYAHDDANERTVCPGAAGYAELLGDCDDRDADVSPSAHEYCNGEDDDCDGEVDEGAVDTEAYFLDADGDGHGEASAWVRACEAPEGYSTLDDDCDDARADVAPSFAEVCDEQDNDCNGIVDDDATDAVTVYDDLDGDGHGVAGTGHTACESAGAPDETDCDDADATVYLDAPEACDLLDNDCDGEVDEGVVNEDYYTDADGDGFGDPADFVVNDCVAPAGAVGNAEDCDDTDPDVSPAEREICDGVDNDCDGEVDADARDAVEFYLDDDADGYGLETDSTMLCTGTGSYTAVLPGDCDDSDGDIYPGAPERDNDADDDCDSRFDEDFVAAGDILLVEIARQTWMGGASLDSDGQWFEVANTTGDAIDLSGWTITRTSAVGTDSFMVDPALAPLIPAGDVAVFCATDLFTIDNDPDSSLECNYFWGDAALADTYTDAYIDNTFHLQRDEDTLTVAVEGTTIDAVAWDAAWPASAKSSIVLLGTAWSDTDNDAPGAWELDTTNVWWDDGTGGPEHGTPGSP